MGSGLWVLLAWNAQHLETIPAHDGTLTEGVLGTVRFINPTLANTPVDRDLSRLLYQGVFKINADGELQPDLARTVTISEDGLYYDIELRQDATFHDGRPVTARDVVYTYQLLQDPDLMSPHRGNWSNVTIDKIDTFSVRLTLSEPYYPFQENLTVGILPEHIWSEIPINEMVFSTRNTNPIGSGPYTMETVSRNEQGSIVQLTLQGTDQTITPINTIVIKTFANSNELLTALADGTVDTTAALTSHDLVAIDTDRYDVHLVAIPRVVGVVFNQNRSPALRDTTVREALELLTDRAAIVSAGTNDTAIPNPKPVPRGYTMLESKATSSPYTATSTASTTAAIEKLTANDWQQNEDGIWERETEDDGTVPLTITIQTFDTPTFTAVAETLAEQWGAIGIPVRVESYEERDLLEGVLRPRDFEVLLFGMDLSRSIDLYPFWHSSQQTDPGLNVAQYTSISGDEYLEKIRSEQVQTERDETLDLFLRLIAEERPGLFLYTPTAPFVARSNISLTLPTRIQTIADRWYNITNWHNKTEQIWPWIER